MPGAISMVAFQNGNKGLLIIFLICFICRGGICRDLTYNNIIHYNIQADTKLHEND